MSHHKNTILALLEQTVRIMVNFFVSIWLVRYLGPSDYGSYSYIITIVTIFFVLSKFGLNDQLIKRLCESQNEQERVSLMTTVVIFKLSISVIAFILLVVLAITVLGHGDITLYICVASIALLFHGFDIIECKYQAELKIKPIVLAKNIQLFVGSLLKVLCIIYQLDLVFFIYIFVFEFLLISIFFLIVYLVLDKNRISLQFDKKEITSFLRLTWPLAIANIAIICYVKVDQIMIYHIIGDEALGIYSSVVKISEAWYFAPTIIATMYFSKILQAKNKSLEAYQHSLKNLLRLQISISLLVAIVVTFVADFVITTAYGEAFKEGAFVLQVHIWAGIFISINRVSVKWHVAENYQKHYMFKGLFGLILNYILNLFFIPLWGISGAAVATLISLLCVELIYYCVFAYSRSFFSLIISSLRM